MKVSETTGTNRLTVVSEDNASANRLAVASADLKAMTLNKAGTNNTLVPSYLLHQAMIVLAPRVPRSFSALALIGLLGWSL